jgi:hypothetical protein
MLRVDGGRIWLTGALAAILLACLPWGNAAQGADFQRDCCAGLEERVAELEATTVGKGNRKVSVTLSGYMAKQVMAWDDGVDGDTYIADIGPTQASNFRISGQAAIAPGWSAGYMIRVQDLTDSTMGLSQDVGNQDLRLNVQMSYWFLASEDYGRLTVGHQALASKSAAMFTDLSGTQIIANYVLFDGPGFFLRQNGDRLALRWGDIGYCYAQARPWGGDCDGIVMTGVRYDSPTLAGFSWSASYGVSGDTETALRYTGELRGFKLALGAGYSVNTDELAQPPPVSPHKDSGFFQAGFYIEHLVTGLFLHADYGNEDNHGSTIFSGLTEPDSEQYYVKAGIRRKWTPLGMTILWGEYTEYLDQIGPAALNAGVTSSEFTRWGLGVAQDIDKAATTLWLRYRQHDGDLDGGPFAGSLDAFRYVSTGAIVYF